LKGKTNGKGRIYAKVIRKNGEVEDLGMVAGPPLQMIWDKVKRSVTRWLQLLN
jgi:hypothetical protein